MGKFLFFLWVSCYFSKKGGYGKLSFGLFFVFFLRHALRKAVIETLPSVASTFHMLEGLGMRE